MRDKSKIRLTQSVYGTSFNKIFIARNSLRARHLSIPTKAKTSQGAQKLIYQHQTLQEAVNVGRLPTHGIQAVFKGIHQSAKRDNFVETLQFFVLRT